MLLEGILVLSALLGRCWCNSLDFPPNFKFGAATAAYQVEGAWNVSDKCESIWDHFTHTRSDATKDRLNGDIACDSYHQFKTDIRLGKEMGMQFYRFSISWPRMLPNGFANYLSEDGKKYYNELIDELVKNNIEPVVTIYHWDLPQKLQELGGWTNPLIVQWFGEYARILYTLYGDRVKIWLTINEPVSFCDVSYSNGDMAPGTVSPGLGEFLCNKYAMLAHTRAYRIYEEEFKEMYDGKVGFANNYIWMQPASESDSEVTQLAMEYFSLRYSDPIYSKNGGWPTGIDEVIGENSLNEGYPVSRLPAFTPEEIAQMRGAFDFIGVNHYTSRVVRRGLPNEKIRRTPIRSIYIGIPEINAVMENDKEWKHGAAEWLYINPKGIRDTLVWLKKTYGDVPILITENGYCDENTRQDLNRVNYYKLHLEQVLKAIKEDNVTVVGYTAWTLIDNFEWCDGYTVKFGLHEVDFNDPKRKRTPRCSAKFYQEVIKRRSLNIPDDVMKHLCDNV